jgi:hypothetical protein
MEFPKKAKGAAITLYINEYKPNKVVEYKTGIKRLIEFTLKLFNSTERLVNFGKSIYRFATFFNSEGSKEKKLNLLFCNKYNGATNEEITLPMINPYSPLLKIGKTN